MSTTTDLVDIIKHEVLSFVYKAVEDLTDDELQRLDDQSCEMCVAESPSEAIRVARSMAWELESLDKFSASKQLLSMVDGYTVYACKH